MAKTSTSCVIISFSLYVIEHRNYLQALKKSLPQMSNVFSRLGVCSASGRLHLAQWWKLIESYPRGSRPKIVHWPRFWLSAQGCRVADWVFTRESHLLPPPINSFSFFNQSCRHVCVLILLHPVSLLITPSPPHLPLIDVLAGFFQQSVYHRSSPCRFSDMRL